MQCRTCGAQITPNAPVCMRCGSPVSAPVHAADQTMFDPSSQRSPFPQYPPSYQGGPSPAPAASFGSPQVQTPPAFNVSPYQQHPSSVQGGFNAPSQQPSTFNNNQPGSSPFQGAVPFSDMTVASSSPLPPQYSFGNGFPGSSNSLPGNAPFSAPPQSPPWSNPNTFPASGQGPQQTPSFPGAAQGSTPFPSSAAWSNPNTFPASGQGPQQTPSFQGTMPPSSSAAWTGQLSYSAAAPAAKKKKSRGLLITLVLIVVVVGGALGVYFLLPGSGHSLLSSNTSIPSGMTINDQAAAIITDAQTASGVNKATFQPNSAQITTSFKMKQSVYVTLTLNVAKYNVSKQPAYLLVKFYANGQSVIKNEIPLTVSRPIEAAYFVAQYYISTNDGAAEIYWCSRANCSDRKLAKVLHFTVSGS
jgi:hypothetical protein